MNTQLVQLSGQKAFTTSLIVAEQCEFEHRSVIQLIRKYQSDFEEFGSLTFQMQKLDFKRENPGRPSEYVSLTEDQATYLITLFRNTPKVRKFKIALVKAFRKAIDEINRLYANPPRTEIIAAKRAAHDPMMLALSDYRADLGKITGNNHYMCENKLCNSVVIGSFSAIDEKSLTNSDAELLRQVRAMNENLIKAGIEYSERKKMLTGFGIRYKTKLISHDNGA